MRYIVCAIYIHVCVYVVRMHSGVATAVAGITWARACYHGYTRSEGDQTACRYTYPPAGQFSLHSRRQPRHRQSRRGTRSYMYIRRDLNYSTTVGAQLLYRATMTLSLALVWTTRNMPLHTSRLPPRPVRTCVHGCVYVYFMYAREIFK